MYRYTHNVEHVLWGLRTTHDLDPVAGRSVVGRHAAVLADVQELEAWWVATPVCEEMPLQPLSVLLAAGEKARLLTLPYLLAWCLTSSQSQMSC